MPKIVPHPIKTDSIAVYGRMIGLRKMRYVLPTLVPIEIHPTGIEFEEQVLVGHSTFFSEAVIRAEDLIKGESDMFSESPVKAETVIISNP